MYKILRPSHLTLMTFLLACFLFNASAGFAGQRSWSGVDELLRRVEKEFEHVDSIELYFYQSIFRKGRGGAVEGEGKAWFRRPDMMRWEYERPEKEVIVVNSDDVFVWEPEANQVMIYKKMRFLPGTIGDIFFPKVKALKKGFEIELVKDSGDQVVIRCRPRQELGNIKKIDVTFLKKGYMYSRIVFEDTLGTRTEIRFRKVRINPDLDNAMFEFRIPDGARVYYQD